VIGGETGSLNLERAAEVLFGSLGIAELLLSLCQDVDGRGEIGVAGRELSGLAANMVASRTSRA
jgi:hypothetical protein